MAVTLKQVAKQSDVSIWTVCQIVNRGNAHLYSDETKSRVTRAAEKLGYRPNRISQALRGKSLKMIGVVTRPTDANVRSSFLYHINLAAWRSGYKVIHGNLDIGGKHDKEAILDIVDRGVDGVIVQKFPSINGIAAILPKSMKYVTIGWGGEDGDIYFDLQNAGALIAGHFVERGHRRVAFFGLESPGNQEKFIGYQGQLEKSGVNLTKSHWLGRKKDLGQEIKRAVVFIKRNKITAVAACNDLWAAHLLKALLAAEVRVPQEVALAGFDGSDFCQCLSPSLTTVYQPTEELATAAVELLVAGIEGRKMTAKKHPARLQVGESS